MKPANHLIAACAIALVAIVFSTAAIALDLRIATYNVELSRKGPGLLLRDIERGKDEQIIAVLDVIAAAKPDVLALQGFDHDVESHALIAFKDALANRGHPLPYIYASAPNTGLLTGLDMDGNGKIGEARDGQGYGRFSGQGGMAVLSRYPLGEVRDFSTFLWKNLPDAIPPKLGQAPFPSAAAFEIQRLSSVAHWDVPILLPEMPPLHLLTFHASTPVFDGDEDRNGRRNHDEIVFWQRYLGGDLPFAPPKAPVIIAGIANLDPADGDGRRSAIQSLLSDPRIRDPAPNRQATTFVNAPSHTGDPMHDTVDWPDPVPGDLRVSYVLPDARLTVMGSGVVWPGPDDPMFDTVQTASRHRLVWVDLRF
ncbi:endonuclease/exonuclease/phosphatase family protein [Aliiroseovarius sp. 2305UL8-7]|uniref:endonuclease/exonuclease/phosphatase family protein n=1 Tax=Aliiroseovarius conchicola TaxID=3121637 RepID=UPI003529A4BD